MLYLLVILLITSHAAAFFAGAHNAKKALAIKDAAKSLKDSVK